MSKVQSGGKPNLKLNHPSVLKTLAKNAKNQEAGGASQTTKPKSPTMGKADSPRKTAAALAEQTEAKPSNPTGSREVTNRQSQAAGALTNRLGMTSFADVDSEDDPKSDALGAGDSAGATEASALGSTSSTKELDPELRRPRESQTTNADGSQVDKKNYVKDGVAYQEKVTTRPDGTTSLEVQATKDGRTETTTSETTNVDGQLSDYVPDEHDHLLSEGMDGPVQQTVTTTKVVDTSQNPPVEKVKTSTTYSTKTEPAPMSGGDMPAVPTDSQVRENSSQKTLSYTESVTDGQKSIQIDSEVTRDATDIYTGEDASATQSKSFQIDADGKTRVVRSEEGSALKGVAQPFLDGDDYQQRIGQMPGERVPYRYTSVSEGGKDSSVYEFGNYDSPRSDGGTVTVTNSNGTKAQSYRLVSEGGSRVQEQTTVPGTEFSQYSDTNYGKDGDDQTFVRNIETKEGDKVLSSSHQERKVAYASAADMPVKAPAGMDQKQWDEFRAQQGDGPVYSDEFQSSTLVPEEIGTKPVTRHGVQEYVIPEHYAQTDMRGYALGDASIGSVTQNNNGKISTTQGMLVGGDSPEASFVVDGQRAEVDGKGQVTVDGVVTGTVDAGQALGSIPAAYSAVMGEISSTTAASPSGTNWNRVGDNFSKGLGAAGVLGGVLGMATADNAVDVVSGVGSTVSGLGSAFEGFGTSNVVKNIGKGLGIAGAAFSTASGLMEIFSEDGNLAKGIADTVSGAAGMTAGVLALCGVTGPVGWITGGVAVAASLVSWGIDIFSEPDQAELKF